MLGIKISDGETLPPIWYDGTMDMAKYKWILTHKVFPALDATHCCGGYIWIQDGALCLSSKTTQAYLERILGSRGFGPRTCGPHHLQT